MSEFFTHLGGLELPPLDDHAEAHPAPYGGGGDHEVPLYAGDTEPPYQHPDGPLGTIYRSGTYAPYDAYQALARAEQEHRNPSRSWYMDCQYFARTRYGLPGIYGSASIAYYNTNDRHTSWPPPPGAFVWWTGGAGHTGLSIGDGTFWGNDFLRTGKIDRVRISAVAPHWGKTYRGWSTDNNEVRCIDLADMIDLSKLVAAVKQHHAVHNGRKVKRALAEEIGRGSMDLGNDVMGGGFRTQFEKLQEKWYGRGDGIPGPTSMLKLCDRHGLTLIP